MTMFTKEVADLRRDTKEGTNAVILRAGTQVIIIGGHDDENVRVRTTGEVREEGLILFSYLIAPEEFARRALLT